MPSPEEARGKRRARLVANCLGFVVGFFVGAGLGTAFLLTVLSITGGAEKNPYVTIPAVIVTVLIWIVGGWAVARCARSVMTDAFTGWR